MRFSVVARKRTKSGAGDQSQMKQRLVAREVGRNRKLLARRIGNDCRQSSSVTAVELDGKEPGKAVRD